MSTPTLVLVNGKYIVGKKDPVEKENQQLKQQISELRKQVSRLRRKLSRFGPVEEAEDEPEVVSAVKAASKQDDDVCQDCAAPLTHLTTPAGTTMAYCSKKCGYKRKLA